MDKQFGVMRNWLSLATSSSFQTILNLFCTVRIARALESDDYGRYTLILTLAMIAQVIASLSLRNISIREITRDPSSFPAVARSMAKAVVLSTTLSAALLWAGTMLQSDSQMTPFLVFIVLLVAAESIWGVMETLAFSQNRMSVSSLLFVASSVVWFLIVFSIPVQQLTLKVVVGSYVAVQLLRSCIYFWWSWQSGYFQLRKGSGNNVFSSTSLVKQSLPLLGSALLALPLSQIPVVFLSQYSGMNEVAFYGIGARLSQPLFLISGTLFSAVYPNMSAIFVSDLVAFRSHTRRLFLMLSTVGIFTSLFVSTLAPEIVEVLFGSRYVPAVATVAMQVWVVLNWIMHNFVGTVFVASDHERRLVVLSFLNAVIVGVAAFIGSHFGAQGLSVGLWTGGMVGFSLHWVVLRRSVRGLFFWRDEASVFASYGILSMLALVIPSQSLEMRLFELGIGLIVAATIFRTTIEDFYRLALDSVKRNHEAMSPGATRTALDQTL